MLAVGDVGDAEIAASELQELAEVFDTDVLRAVVAQAEAPSPLARATPGGAIDPLRRAFDLWQRLEAPYEAARVRVLIAEACRALGDDRGGGARIQQRRGPSSHDLGARPDLRAARMRPRPHMRQPRPRRPLTARELQVLRLIATGRTNKDIADELCLSERTIDRHVSNILSKLDVPSARAATAYGLRPSHSYDLRSHSVTSRPLFWA